MPLGDSGYVGQMVKAGADERYIVVKGRRWRATEPTIPAPFQSELRHELMDARRAVKAALGNEDAVAERHARDRVQNVKVALGERGPLWWEELTDEQLTPRLRSAMLALLHHRAPESTICPSDAARVAGGEAWRTRMDAARAVAFALQAEGLVEIRQAGKRITRLENASGPLRIARGKRF